MEAIGVREIYSNMQPTSESAIGKVLIRKRLDVCLQYFLDDGRTEIYWSQEEVILVSYEANIPKKQVQQACYKAGEAVIILWEKNKEINAAVIEFPQSLLKSKCNPMATHSHGSWIFDVEIRKINYITMR